MHGTMLFVLFFSVTGSRGMDYDGLSRYSLVPFVFLVLGTQQRFAASSPDRPRCTAWVGLPLAFLAAVSWVAQVAIARIFLSGKVMY